MCEGLWADIRALHGGDCGRVKGARCEHGAPLSVRQTAEDSVTVVRSCHVVTREVRHGMAGSDTKKAPLS